MRARSMGYAMLVLLMRAAGAEAADAAIPMRKASAPIPAYNWTGIYIGGHIGAGVSYRDWTLIRRTHIGSRRCRSAGRSDRPQLSGRQMGVRSRRRRLLGQPEEREPVPGQQYLLDQGKLAGYGNRADWLRVRSGTVLPQGWRCVHPCRVFQDGSDPLAARRDGRRAQKRLDRGRRHGIRAVAQLDAETGIRLSGVRLPLARFDQHRDRGIWRKPSAAGESARGQARAQLSVQCKQLGAGL